MAGTRPGASQLWSSPLDPAFANLDWTFDLALSSNVDTLVALLPVNGAAFAKLVFEDQSIQNTLCLVHRASDICIVDGHRANRALGIDDEQCALGNTLLLDQDAIVLAQLVVTVADQRHVNASQPAFHLISSIPGPEAVLAVRAGERHGAGAAVQEFLETGAEGADFGWADEGPCFRKEY